MAARRAAFALGIFIADLLSHLEIAAAVLYVAVVLMAARFCRARGLLLVSLVCVGLTVLGFVLSPPSFLQWAPTKPEAIGFISACLSISAIGLTTLIVVKSQPADAALREQANLLDLTHDTVFSRGMNDVITYWNRGAEELYGWARSEAIGKVTHQVLGSSFSATLDEVNAALLRTGRWEGELVHTKRGTGRPLWSRAAGPCCGTSRGGLPRSWRPTMM
jgi:PAS domain S-box-containing protein